MMKTRYLSSRWYDRRTASLLRAAILALLLPTAIALLLPPLRVISPIASRGTLVTGSLQPSLLLRRASSSRVNLDGDPQVDQEELVDGAKTGTSNSLDWVNYGISWVYLAQFASLYVQLPGLFGPTGLSPISDRISDLSESLWAIHLLPDTFVGASPELGLESFAAVGIVVSVVQIALSSTRNGVIGILSYGLQWLLWHDLVMCGGRFTAYQMDELLLDAAPLTLLTSSGISPAAAKFAFRWLLSRLYLGAGAIKFLTCDLSWRNLSAIHWHLQSQPIPNLVGAASYKILPAVATHTLTLAVLVIEMAAPYLFLAPSKEVRRVAFVLNVLLMVGIALFGDFGTLQVLLAVIGLVLLDDLPPAPGVNETKHIDTSNTIRDKKSRGERLDVTAIEGFGGENLPNKQEPSLDWSSAVSAFAVALAAAGALWAVVDVNSACRDSLMVAPLVFALIVLGAVVATLPLLTEGFGSAVIASITSLAILSGTVVPLTGGLGITLPYELARALDSLNLGAVPYRLFGTITGVYGRPVASIEASYSVDGPWLYVPLRYQVNAPSSSLPFCFPHFPRFDWTLWFVPIGETGPWIKGLFRGIVAGDPAIVDGLLDGPAFHKSFPEGPPEFVRMMPRLYELNPEGVGWLVADDPASPMVRKMFSREYLLAGPAADASSWTSLPVVRALAGAGKPEYFVWGWLAFAEATRRAAARESAQ